MMRQAGRTLTSTAGRRRLVISTLSCLAALGAIFPAQVATAQAALADVYATYPNELGSGPFATTASLFFAVGNAGPSAAGSVALTFSLPAGVTVSSAVAHSPWSPTSPGPGERSCELSSPATLVCLFDGTFDAQARAGVSLVLVNTGLAADTTVQVYGHLSSDTVDPAPTNNDVLASITFSGAAVDLDAADLEVEGNAVEDQDSPSIRSLLFWVRNSGPGPAVGATLTVSVPDGAALIAMEPPPHPPWLGEQPTVCAIAADRRTATCRVGRDLPRGFGEYVRAVVANTTLTAGTTVEVTASADASTVDGFDANDSVTVPVTFTGGPVALDAADLGLAMAGGHGNNDPSAVRLDLSVHNKGPATATGITITIDVPDGVAIGSGQSAPADVPIFASCPLDTATRRLVCTSVDLPIGSGRQLPIVAINVGLPAGSTTELQVRVEHAEADPRADNDTLSAPITFSGAPVPTRPEEATTELAVVANEPRSESPGAVTFVWNIAVRGPASAQGLTAVVQLGAGLQPTWAALLPSGGACPVDPALGTITCKLSHAWPVGEPLGLLVSANYAASEPGERFQAEAFVASDRPDLEPTNNRSLAAFTLPGARVQPTTVTAAQTTPPTLPPTGRDGAGASVLGAALLAAGLHLVVFGIGSSSMVNGRIAPRRRRRAPRPR